MKLTNAEAYAALEAVAPLLPKEGMGARAAYKVHRLAAALQAAIKPAEDVRGKVLTEYVIKDDEGKPLPVTDASGRVLEGQVRLTAEGGKQLSELFAIEIEVDAEPLTLDELEPAKPSPQTIGGLGPFVEAD